jgi:hypothetical protein
VSSTVGLQERTKAWIKAARPLAARTSQLSGCWKSDIRPPQLKSGLLCFDSWSYTTKTYIRRQVQSSQPGASGEAYGGLWSSLARMWKTEGFAGFMKGNGINVIRVSWSR